MAVEFAGRRFTLQFESEHIHITPQEPQLRREPPPVPAEEPQQAPTPLARDKERRVMDNFWRSLSPPEQEAFASVADERTFAAGTVVMQEGEQANHVIVIRSGWTKICVHEGGAERTIAERGPGQLVGERGALHVSVRSATVVALETVQALAMKTEDFAAFVSAHPRVLGIVEGQLYGRLTEEPVGTHNGVAVSGPITRPDTLARMPPQPAGEFWTVVLTDVVAFGGPARNDEDRRVIRDEHRRMVEGALGEVWGRCRWEDRGDGLLIIVPPSVPAGTVIDNFVSGMRPRLKAHNRLYGPSVRFQLRVAVEVGPVDSDLAGYTGRAIIQAARLLDAAALRDGIAESGANLGVIASAHVYDNVIGQACRFDSEDYVRVSVTVKETEAIAWMRLLDS